MPKHKESWSIGMLLPLLLFHIEKSITRPSLWNRMRHKQLLALSFSALTHLFILQLEPDVFLLLPHLRGLPKNPKHEVPDEGLTKSLGIEKDKMFCKFEKVVRGMYCQRAIFELPPHTRATDESQWVKGKSCPECTIKDREAGRK
jgi:hypothetical protein